MIEIDSMYKLDAVASKDESRLAINAVRIESDRAIATDGRALAIIPLKPHAEGPVSITAKFFEKARRDSKKKAVAFEIKDKLANFRTSDGNLLIGGVDQDFQGFPSINRVIPDDFATRKITVQFDLQILVRLCAAMGTTKIALCVREAEEAIIVQPVESQVSEALGILMPLRSDPEQPLQPRDWLKLPALVKKPLASPAAKQSRKK